MKVLNTEKETCHMCQAEITIREYVGLEGAWYSDHFCPAIRTHNFKECAICNQES